MRFYRKCKKLILGVESEKFIIDGSPNHTFKEWVQHYQNMGHTLIDITPDSDQEKTTEEATNSNKTLPEVTITGKAPSQQKQEQNRKVELLQSAKNAIDFRNNGNKDITNPAYSQHFGNGETFYDPSKGTYMSADQKLAWDEAERKNRKFNNEVDNIIGGTTIELATAGFTGGLGILPDLIAGTAAYEAGNYASDKLTGKTVDQWINKGIGVNDESTIGTWVTPMLNPFGWATAATFRPLLNVGKSTIHNIANGTIREAIKEGTPRLINHTKESLYNFGNNTIKIGKKIYPYVSLAIPFAHNPYSKGIRRIENLISATNKYEQALIDDNIKANKEHNALLQYFKSPRTPWDFSLPITASQTRSTTSTVHIPFPESPYKDFTIIQEQVSSDIPALQLSRNGVFSASSLNTPYYRIRPGNIPVATERFPIKTVSGDLQEATRALRTELEKRIGDDGIVAGSVYKLSEGHFQGSNLVRNPNSAPHDIEIWTYSNQAADEIGHKLGMSLDGTGGMTRKYRNPSGDAKVEIAVIESTPSTGKATGDLAWQFYETAFPDEALKLKAQYAEKGIPFNNGDLPISAKELYDIYKSDPKLLDLRTRIDTFTAAGSNIDFSTGLKVKQKHYDRTGQMLMDTSENTINKNRETIDHIYRQIWGTQGGEERIPSRVYNQIDFGNTATNEMFLKKLGFSDEIAKQMAQNPEQMKNVFDYWYLQKMCGKRFSNGNGVQEARTTLSTNISPEGRYARGGGGNQSIDTVWSWNGDYTGLIYNPLTYHPENVKSLEDVVKIYEKANTPTTINYHRLPNESIEDYARRIYDESLKQDTPFLIGRDKGYLGRFAKENPSDVGSLQKGPSVKVGGTFSEKNTDILHDFVPSDDISILEHAKDNGIPLEIESGEGILRLKDIMTNPDINPEFMDGLRRNIPGVTLIEDKMKTEGLPFDEAFKKLFIEYRTKLSEAAEKVRLVNAEYTKNLENANIRGDSLHQLRNKLYNKERNYNYLRKLVVTLEALTTMGAAVGYYLHNNSQKSELRNKLITLEKERDTQLKSNPHQTEQINKKYDMLRDNLLKEYNVSNSIKLNGTPDNTQVSTAVQNARKKYKQGGFLNKGKRL